MSGAAGAGGAGGSGGSAYGGGTHRSFEERAAAREQMMASVGQYYRQSAVSANMCLAHGDFPTRPPCLRR